MFENASKRVKKQLMRLIFLYNEIDYLKDDYCHGAVCPDNVQHAIDVLYKQIDSIRDEFFLDKSDE